MANVYLFSFIPVARAWSDPFDSSIKHPARRLGEREATVVAENSEEAREKLIAQFIEDEKGAMLEDIKVLKVSPWIS